MTDNLNRWPESEGCSDCISSSIVPEAGAIAYSCKKNIVLSRPDCEEKESKSEEFLANDPINW